MSELTTPVMSEPDAHLGDLFEIVTTESEVA